MLFARSLAAIARPISFSAKRATNSTLPVRLHNTTLRTLYNVTPFEKASALKHGAGWKSRIGAVQLARVELREENRKKWLQEMKEEHGDNWEAAVQARDAEASAEQNAKYHIRQSKGLARETSSLLALMKKRDNPAPPKKRAVPKPVATSKSGIKKASKREKKLARGAKKDERKQAKALVREERRKTVQARFIKEMRAKYGDRMEEELARKRDRRLQSKKDKEGRTMSVEEAAAMAEKRRAKAELKIQRSMASRARAAKKAAKKAAGKADGKAKRAAELAAAAVAA